MAAPSCFTDDLSLLYDLSLSVGATLEPHDNARAFVDTLVARTPLDYAAVWMRDGANGFQRVQAATINLPAPVPLPQTHPLWIRLQDAPSLSLSTADAAALFLFPDRSLPDGAYVAHRLGELGFVEFFRAGRSMPFSDDELEPLAPLLSKLQRALQGSRAHQRLQHEVDERRRADERLRRSQSRLSTLIQNLQDAVLVENADREVILANRAFCDLFQIPGPPDTLVGADCAAAAEAAKGLFADPAVLTDRVQAILDAGTSITAETLHMTDGRIIERDYVPIRLDGESLGHLWTYRDVTAQRQADARLQESELRFRTMFEKHSAPMLLIDPGSGAIVAANASAVRFYGYDADTITTMTIQEINQLSAEEVASRRAAAESEEQNRFVFPHRLQSGEIRTVEVYSTPITVEGDSLLFSIIHDITERQNAEEKLRQSEERWRRLVESHRDPIQISVDGVVRYINPAGADVFGAGAPDEVVGRRMTDFVTQEDVKATLRARMEQLNRGMPTDPFEYEIERLDGERRLIEVYSTPIDYNGDPAVQTVIHDITTQREHEAEIRRLKDFYEQILNVMPIDLAIFDPEGRYQYITPSALRDPALRAQIIGMDDIEYARMRGHDLERARRRRAIIRRVARTRETERFEETIESPDGTARHFIRFVAPVITHDVVTQVVGYGLDITHRKQAETQLLAAKQQAEASLAAKERFLATMSHEIRTPLNAVLGMAHLLADSDLTDTQRSYLDSILFSGRTLLTLLNTVLDFARVDAGEIVLESQPFAPAELARNVCSMFHSKAAEKNVALTVSADPALPEWVNGDAARVSQVLTNLVSNALKFTDEGEIRIELEPTGTPPDRPSALLPDSDPVWLTLRVVDTGIGIAEDQQPFIFDDFRRANGPEVQARSGAGLGLAIVRRILDEMGGTIELDSTVGEGSTFTLHIPFAPAPAPATPGGEDVPPPQRASSPRSLNRLAGAHVLVADDNTMNQIVARDLLSSWGAEVDVVTDGTEALERVQARPYDLVLMDVQMPTMDGLEATRRLRTQGYEVPVIALTASMLQSDRDYAFDAGMDAFVSKPFDPDVLYQTVAQHIAGVPPDGKRPPPTPSNDLPPPADDAPTVDLALLHANLDSPATVRHIAHTFVEQVDTFVDDLTAAREDNDVARIAQRIHWMKSPAHMVKAHPLTRQLRALDASEPPYDDDALDEVVTAARAAQAAMRDRLAALQN